MICPNKICKKEIPNDSVFCDQCGVRLRQCTQCGSISIAKFCTECGGVVVDRKIPEGAPEVVEGQTVPVQQSQTVQNPEPAGTVIIDAAPVLSIIHPSFTLVPGSGDILGRTTGPHSAQLGQFPVISSKHGKVELIGNDWYFTDLHSSNKSYLNGKVMTPDVPVKLSDNDNLVLANVSFKVEIK